MTLSVADILRIPGLALSMVAGEAGCSHPVRWVHVSELEDPTPWLKGGELLLTTGMGVGTTPARQRAYVRRLAKAGLSGMGFGLGFSFSKVPRPIVTAAEAEGFPVFEVPYPVPFIAITEAVFSRLATEQYDVLQRAVEAHHVLTRALLEGGGVEGVAEALARIVDGWVLLLDLRGRPIAASGRSALARADRLWEELRDSRPEGMGYSITVMDQGHHVSVQPVGAHGRVEAFLAVGKPRTLTQLDRIVSGHALSLFAIEMSKARAVAEAERRLAGGFFDGLVRGSLPPAEANRSLVRFGFDREAPVQVFAFELLGPFATTEEMSWAAESILSRSGGPFLLSPHAGGIHLLTRAGVHDVEDLRAQVAERISAPVRAGAGSAVPPLEAGRSLREARYALQVCKLEKWLSAGFDKLGTYRLLLSMAEPDALRAFADSLLAPIDEYDEGGVGGDLLESLRAFLEHNARWETAAAELFVHRHTLRYRMRKVEELTGRDLGSSFDRMEFWLAIRARELLAADVEGE